MAAGELKWKLEFGFGLLFDGCNRTGELDWEFEYGLEFEGGWGIGELNWEFKLEFNFEVESAREN